MKKTEYRYYSHHGEDFLLWKLFDYKTNGFYVDVGAFDGVHLSNSYSFEQHNWSGICVEANPAYFKICKESRTGANCLNAACVGDDSIQKIEFYAEELGLLSGIRGNREDDVRSRYEKRGLEFKGFSKITVPALTLNAILGQYLPASTEIDFISIDVEGSESDVLKGLDLTRFRPRVIVIEANTEEANEALNTCLVQQNGYIKARTIGVNVFYVRDLKDVKALNSIPLNCKLEKNIHPLGEKYTLPSHAQAQVVRGEGGKQAAKSVNRNLFDKLLSIFNN